MAFDKNYTTFLISKNFSPFAARKVAEDHAKRVSVSGMEMSPGSGIEIVYPAGSNSPRPMQVTESIGLR